MNKQLFFLYVIISFMVIPAISISQDFGYSVFPQESIDNLMFIASGANTSSFVVVSNNGEQVTGYLGDFIGFEEAKVIKVTDKDITVQNIEIVVDENNNQHEQPTRMKIPTSFGFAGHGKGSR